MDPPGRVVTDEEVWQFRTSLDALRRNRNLARENQATMDHTRSRSEQEVPPAGSNPGVRRRFSHITTDDQTGVFLNMLRQKHLASKNALESLEEVDLGELPEDDRTCVICYNEYETQSPEGFYEKPTRLPKCKHIFGDRCIRRWFEESDRCPYCRERLHDARAPPSTRVFLDMIRIRGWTEGSAMAEDFYRRIMAGEDVRPIIRRGVGARRPPPDNDEYDNSSRRTRQRRSSPPAVEQELPLPTQSRSRPLSAEQEPPLPRQSPGSLRQAIQQWATPNSPVQASPTQTGNWSNTRLPMVSARPEPPGRTVEDHPLRHHFTSRADLHRAMQQQQQATSHSRRQASPMQTEVSSNPWVSMGSAPPGPPSSITQNAPSQYQSNPWLSMGSAPPGPPGGIVQNAPLRYPSSNPWLSAGFAPPGPPSSIAQNAPLRYQSPARPAQSTVVYQPNWAVHPSTTRQGTFTTNVGAAANLYSMPNPLQYGAQASQMGHGVPTETPMNSYEQMLYAASAETPMNQHGYMEDTYPRERGFI